MYIANLKDCHWDKEGSSAFVADLCCKRVSDYAEEL